MPSAPVSRPPTGSANPLEDLPAAVDAVSAAARAEADVDAFEVRADVSEDHRFIFDGRHLQVARVIRLGGVGVRVFIGGASSYAYTTEASADAGRAAVAQAARVARASARRGVRGFAPDIGSARKAVYRVGVERRPRHASIDEVNDLLVRCHSGAVGANAAARGRVSFGARERVVIYTDSAGSWVENEYLLSTLLAHYAHRESGRIGDGATYLSGERGITDFEDEGGPEGTGAEAARRAVEYARAESAPVGRYRVLCDNHLTGLLAHESFGHLTEYDLVASGWSVLKGRRGDALAAEDVTIVDAPTVDTPTTQGVRVPLDEEGTLGRPVKMLDRGRLSIFMHTRDTASAEGDAPTGNARALSVRHPPIVRMRNTYFEPGDLSFEEALEELDDGIYLCGGRGGAPHSEGSFMFTAQRGYRVEKGEIVAPLRAASIYGNIFDFLKGVSGLTRDFRVFTNFFGGCGKWNQNLIHVGLGGPHVLVDNALVGGEAGAAVADAGGE